MKALTREAINLILPILTQDELAKRELALYVDGRGSLSGAALAVRKHASRIYDEGKIELPPSESRQLEQFIVTYGRPGNAAKTGESRIEGVNVLFTPSERQRIRLAAKKAGMPQSTYVHEIVVRALREALGSDDGI